ncbi:MAG TPA: MMPL family transporter [Jatrophihabitantaceae bacterium]|jgi:RND superfamily putative drug exporter
MFAWWGTQVVRWRRWLLVAGVLFALVGGLWGTRVFGALSNGGFDDQGSENQKAQALLDQRVGNTNPDVVVLFRNPNVTVDDPAFERTVDGAMAKFPAGFAVATNTYWTTHSAAFVSADRHETFAAVSLKDRDESIDMSKYDAMRDTVKGTGYTVQVGGQNGVFADINDQVKKSIARAEGLSMPVLLVLLTVVFGSLAAASLPLAVGALAILGSFIALRVISFGTDVSVFAVNIVTILGLGLAIDYGLFMVSRFREELRRGSSTPDAVMRTMATAGRTVAVSAVTVAVSLAGLLIFPQTFLKSMGYGGISAVLVAALAALTVLPALLAVLGPRVDALSARRLFRRRRPSMAEPAAEHGFWFRWANAVMRRPGVFAVPVVAVLLVLGAPFLHVKWGGIDARMEPKSAESRQVSDVLLRDFPGSRTDAIEAAVSLDVPVDSPAGQTALTEYSHAAGSVPGATGAGVVAAKGRTAQVDVTYRGQALDGTAKDVLKDVRATPRPAHVQDVLVGGSTAQVVDRLHSLGSRLPWMALVVVLATFVLLFLAFGSLVLPIKALLMNVLSLGASFGVVTWIFQSGHLSGLLGFTPTGTVEATQPVLVLAIIFGLSMDYEVFLLSRVREQYDATGDNRLAVATGIQRTGRIITAAALLLMVVIGAFSASPITFIKLIGVAMLVALVVDATIVRMILVPATMRLLGTANWWAPRPLRRFYARYGFRESDQPEVADRTPVSV